MAFGVKMFDGAFNPPWKPVTSYDVFEKAAPMFASTEQSLQCRETSTMQSA